jgi:hypothetical protein
MADKIFACDVSLDKAVPGIGYNIADRGTIVQTVDIYDADVRIGGKQVVNKVGTDEAAATRYKNIHLHRPPII